MTDLKMRTKTMHTVSASDLEDFIQDRFGIEFSFQADQEAGNDTDHEFMVDGQVDEYCQANVDKILAGGYDCYVTRDFLNYMARAGMIPTGDYLITLSY